ncbi:hypothetical protein BU17DRAFT_63910 [Hysterangium stoloniferum]|nr:hypothetical protein BU17DRAFT_63910 [Hysterangium stoloniferum]
MSQLLSPHCNLKQEGMCRKSLEAEDNMEGEGDAKMDGNDLEVVVSKPRMKVEWRWMKMSCNVNNSSVSIQHPKDLVTHSMAPFFELGTNNRYPALNFHYSTEVTFSGRMLVIDHIK